MYQLESRPYSFGLNLRLVCEVSARTVESMRRDWADRMILKRELQGECRRKMVDESHAHTGDDGIDAFVEQRHGRCAVDQICQRFDQFLAETWFKRCQCTKLFDVNGTNVGAVSSVEILTSLMILIRTQLLVDEVMRRKKIGAKAR